MISKTGMAFAAGLFALSFYCASALAADCGVPPGDPPPVPDGTTATVDQIRAATRAVQDYGSTVQKYLNCMRVHQDDFFLNMNDDQRKRWTDDYNSLADTLEKAEVFLNEQIRIFNRRS